MVNSMTWLNRGCDLAHSRPQVLLQLGSGCLEEGRASALDPQGRPMQLVRLTHRSLMGVKRPASPGVQP